MQEIIEGIMMRGKDLLVKYSDQIRDKKYSPQDMITSDILARLENVQTEALLLASTFKVASETQGMKLEEIKGTRLEVRLPRELSYDEKSEMIRIFQENRPTYSKRLLQDTLREFKNALDAKDKEFYIFTDTGQIVAFIRFDDLPNGNLYAGSLNVRPEARGSAIGSAMLGNALYEKGKDHTIEAVVYKKNPMLKRYLSDFGFKIIGEIPNYHGTGELFYQLERPKGTKLEELSRVA